LAKALQTKAKRDPVAFTADEISQNILQNCSREPLRKFDSRQVDVASNAARAVIRKVLLLPSTTILKLTFHSAPITASDALLNVSQIGTFLDPWPVISAVRQSKLGNLCCKCYHQRNIIDPTCRYTDLLPQVKAVA
jgi:hypothetical protein